MLLKPVPGGLEPNPIYHSKAHKLLYNNNLADLLDGQLTCLRSVMLYGSSNPDLDLKVIKVMDSADLLGTGRYQTEQIFTMCLKLD